MWNSAREESSVRTKSKISFRPAVESAEERVLATAGLAAHPAEVHASSAPQAQAWVEIVNRTDRPLTFQLSADGGSTYHTYRLRGHTEGAYHVNRSDPTFLLKEGNGSPTELATGTSRKGAYAYSLRADLSVTPGPGLRGVGAVGGVATPLTNVARFSILNQTSKSSGSGGIAVTIQFSVDGGKTYPLSDTVPYTGGLVPRHETIHYGNLGILYKIPANPTIRPTPLTSLGQYFLFSNTSFQPYLSPSS
jgi:hypothetical protein